MNSVNTLFTKSFSEWNYPWISFSFSHSDEVRNVATAFTFPAYTDFINKSFWREMKLKAYSKKACNYYKNPIKPQSQQDCHSTRRWSRIGSIQGEATGGHSENNRCYTHFIHVRLPPIRLNITLLQEHKDSSLATEHKILTVTRRSMFVCLIKTEISGLIDQYSYSPWRVLRDKIKYINKYINT